MNNKNKKADGRIEGAHESSRKRWFSKLRGLSRKTLYIIIGVIFVSLLLIFVALFKINFMVGEQLRITLTPEYSEIKTTSPGNVSFDIDMHLYNKFVCDAVCSYTLSDESHNITLDNGTFHSKAYKSKSYSFNIPIKYYGYGTNIYFYRLECYNIQTTLCPASDDILVRKSLLAVTYTPSTEQLSALDFSRKNYAIISENVVNSSKFIIAEQDVINSMVKSSISFDNLRYYALKSERDAIDDAVNKLMTLWETDEYISTKSFIINTGLVNRSTVLFTDVVQYDAYLLTTLANHNNLLSELNSTHSVLEEYTRILSFNISTINPSTSQSMINAINDGNVLFAAFNSKNYNYSMLYDNNVELRGATINLDKVIINNTQSELYEDNPALYVYSHMLCMMNFTINASIQNSGDKSSINFCDYNYNMDINNLSKASTRLSNVCDYSSNIIAAINALSVNSTSASSITSGINTSGNNSGNNSTIISVNDSMETLLLQYNLLIDYASLYNNTGTNPILISYADYIRSSLNKSYNIDDPETLLSGYEFNTSLIVFNPNNFMLYDIRNIQTSCNANSNANSVNGASIPKLTVITASYYSIPAFDMSNDISNKTDATDIYPRNLPEIVPQCCMYDKCQSCSKAPNNNPLILLHGHSFNQNNNAYQSIEIFDSFESALSDDKLYYSTGMLINNGNSSAGILGQYNVPIVSKPTYYLETYNDLLGLTVSESKTTNIDTYALRLKESIDYTMYITGSSKVDIVAHSMGGLVVRRYMQIFGTQNLGTVILIASPNNGISDTTYNLCKIFGASNECEDMRPNSIFIKKLNDFSSQPDLKTLYLVVGRGCNTDGLDGDGIVSVNSSLMSVVPDSRVFYVNGTCSGTTFLHNELLNVDKYSEVYDFVKSKLEK